MKRKNKRFARTETEMRIAGRNAELAYEATSRKRSDKAGRTRRPEGEGEGVFRLYGTQNQCWQGAATWLDGEKRQNSRSAWDLPRRMGGVLQTGNDL